MIEILLFLSILANDSNHFVIVKGTLPYQFEPYPEWDFSEDEKDIIMNSIDKFNSEFDGCLRIV